MIDLEEKLYWDTQDNIIPLYVSYDILYKGWCIPYYEEEKNLDKKLLTKLSELKAKEQKLMQDILPNYYSWEVPVKISLDTVKLKSEVKTDKDNYLHIKLSTIELTILDNDFWTPSTEKQQSL